MPSLDHGSLGSHQIGEALLGKADLAMGSREARLWTRLAIGDDHSPPPRYTIASSRIATTAFEPTGDKGPDISLSDPGENQAELERRQ